MATIKPRITVTLTSHQHKVLSVLASLSGGSMSGFIGELIEASLPVLEGTAATLQRVKAAHDAKNAQFVSSMAAAQSDLEPVVDAALSQFDLFLQSAEKHAGLRGRPAQKVRALPARPPAAKRGRTDSQRAALKGPAAKKKQGKVSTT